MLTILLSCFVSVAGLVGGGHVSVLNMLGMIVAVAYVMLVIGHEQTGISCSVNHDLLMVYCRGLGINDEQCHIL